MALNHRMADALERVRRVTDTRGAQVVRSRELSRQDRELLSVNQWLQKITKGWYLLTRPDAAPGDSNPWYSHFWEFLRCYLDERFGSDYCLSAESSLILHTGYSIVPSQVIVIVKKGAGNPIELPFGTSLLPYANPSQLPSDRESVRGLQVMPLPLSLIRLSPSFFTEKSAEVQLGLRIVRDPSDLSRPLTEGGHLRAAARLIAAYCAIGETTIAERLESDLKAAGMQLPKKRNPFDTPPPDLHFSRSPYAARIEVSWAHLRGAIEVHFPPPPGIPDDRTGYLNRLEELYSFDAYHSLSIEGYQVSPELIDKVCNHDWNPSINDKDRRTSQALAARGYFEAFSRVKGTIERILLREDPVQRASYDLQDWYQALWAPSVRANLLESHHVIGYRRSPVYIRGSRHTPPPREALLDAMDTLFKCMEQEAHPAVRAILGHYLFVFIHPYMDGNGRMARFLMNAMFASGGYPWTVIRVEHRRAYFDALETTHLTDDISAFARLVLQEMQR